MVHHKEAHNVPGGRGPVGPTDALGPPAGPDGPDSPTEGLEGPRGGPLEGPRGDGKEADEVVGCEVGGRKGDTGGAAKPP